MHSFAGYPQLQKKRNSNISLTEHFFSCKLSLVLSGSLLLNDVVCLSYLFIKLVNDILDIWYRVIGTDFYSLRLLF